MTLIQPEGSETDKLGVIGVDHLAYTYASLGDLVDAFETNEDANAFMHDRFGVNPIGVEFDADAGLQRLRAGASESEFFTRKLICRYRPFAALL
jgi:hypothetical protein